MTLRDFKTALVQHSDHNLHIILPDGVPIPTDFHITEVGHVRKNFVDCGGTVRSTEAVVLQAWVARNDPDHRLTACKLASILELAKTLLPSDQLEVEIEFETGVVSQYPVANVRVEGSGLTFALARKHTDCLDKAACGLESCGCDSSEAGDRCG